MKKLRSDSMFNRLAFVALIAIFTLVVFEANTSLALLTDSGNIGESYRMEEVVHTINAVNGSEASVTNNTMTEDSYIRAMFVVNWRELDTESNATNVVWGTPPVRGKDFDLDVNSTDWVEYPTDSGIYYWTDRVASGETTGKLFENFELLNTAEVPAGYKLCVDVIAQSIQADGFDSKGNRPVEIAWGVDIVNGSVVEATLQ